MGLTTSDYEKYIGKQCRKKSINGLRHYKVKPFKSTLKTNTIKGVINHPHLNVPAYIFHEDDTCVECRRVEIIE
jgi:hypothetical protein